MTTNTQLAEQLCHYLHLYDGATIARSHPDTPIIQAYTVGGMYTHQFAANTVTPTLVAAWLNNLPHSIDTIGIWVDSSTGIVHVDGVTLIHGEPSVTLRKAAQLIAAARNELAYGYIDYHGKFTEFNTDNDVFTEF